MAVMQPQASSKVDLSFRISGGTVPMDHGYALFGALGHALGDLHGATWLGVHPIVGIPRGDGLLRLHPSRGALRLRVDAAEIPRVLALAGSTIEIEGHPLHLGVSTVHPLRPWPVLSARVVTIKGFMEPEPFSMAIRRKLEEMEVQAEVDVGRRRVVSVRGDRVVGFATTLRGLSDDHALRVLHAGLGGRRRVGCGLFDPAERTS